MTAVPASRPLICGACGRRFRSIEAARDHARAKHTARPRSQPVDIFSFVERVERQEKEEYDEQ